MIYKELEVMAGTQMRKVFLQDGFYLRRKPTGNLHSHTYGEIHLVTGGKAVFRIGKEIHDTDAGNLFLIPNGVFHCCDHMEAGARHTAFQVDCKAEKIFTCSVGGETVADFFAEIERCGTAGDYRTVAAYIGLFCSFCTAEKIAAKPVTDYAFLIHEFFSLHYSEELQLCDLAQALHLSNRQTERLVIQYTGHSFREEITQMRLSMAKRLLEAGEMSLGEAAQYVGYRSYAGFWKAVKRLEEKQ